MRPGWIAVVVAGAVGLVAAPVAAQGTVEARQAAEACEADARRAGDRDLYDRCGAMYLAMYEQDPDGDAADELLYNAAVMFREAASVDRAIAVFERLRAGHRRSRLAARALKHIGMLSAQIGRFAEAATALETYARTYAGEQDAYDALSDAVFYRRGLGQHQAVIDDTQYFIKTFGGKRPGDAAEAYFALTRSYQALGDDGEVVKHLRSYLKRYGDKGGPVRRIVAYATLGEILWKQSCKKPAADGLCTKVQRARKKARKGTLPTRCGADARVSEVRVPRKARLVAQATAALAAAIELSERLESRDAADPAARHATAQARLRLAEALHEEALAIRFPDRLSFDPANPARARKSLRAFDGWLRATSKALSAASAGYQALVVTGGDPATSIDAAARLGQLWYCFAATLWTAPIPTDVRTGKRAAASVEAYCAAMQAQAEPAEQQAVEAYAACLTQSAEWSLWRPASARCEAALSSLRPDEFPAATELRATPTFTWR